MALVGFWQSITAQPKTQRHERLGVWEHQAAKPRKSKTGGF